jgi:KUP system potassium uptake protein
VQKARPGHGGGHGANGNRRTLMLTLGALGVVFGDIGTSPLYSVRESFGHHHDIVATEANVMGVLSLITWSLIVVVSIKYLVFVLRADNEGEGGILALTSLATPKGNPTQRRWALILVGIFGAALLYGDGMITPAISVLSAVEGIEVAQPGIKDAVIPIAVLILVGVFAVQNRGTGAVGKLFGPIMLVWFGVLTILGLTHLFDAPRVFEAVNPLHALDFFRDEGWEGFLVLGSVVLVVTGGEALYADMGHFGRRPMRLAWFSLVLPALLVTYYGQGALLLSEPEAVENPFFEMGPHWAIIPMTVLATLATVIASQALISGVFSLTMQAIQLDYVPRMKIDHTSEDQMGQIYLPTVNWALMVSCIALVVGFRSSSNLAAAYGVAVVLTMLATTVLFYVVVRERWGWKKRRALLVCAPLLIADLAFLVANLIKIPDGGWLPLVVAFGIFGMMTTWRTGRVLVGKRLRQGELPLATFIKSLSKQKVTRVPGTAVFMYSRPGSTPPALLANLFHNRILHENVVILSVRTMDVPRVPAAEREELIDHGQGFFSVRLRFGFMEEPDVPMALGHVLSSKVSFDPLHTSYFLGKESIRPSPSEGMAIWRERLFAIMHRNATGAASFFSLPPERTIELGRQVDI